MARQTENLPLYAFAAVDADYSDQALGFHNPEEINRKWQNNEAVVTRMVYARIPLPSSIGARSRLYSATAVVSIEAKYQYSVGSEGAFLCPANAAYSSSSTLTWTNRPRQLGDYELVTVSHATSQEDIACDIFLDNPTTTQQSELAHNFLAKRTCFCYPSIAPTSEKRTRSAYFYNKLTDGTTVPYITIAYDDSAVVTSKVNLLSYPSGDSVNNAAAQVFSWEYIPNGSYHCMDENWTQASAKIYWRVSGASTWNEIAISGSATSKTVPAYTFPPNSTIEWYLSGTDTDGTTTTTSTATFTTIPFTVTPTSYPSGSNIDTRAALRFEYEVQNSAGTVLQNGSIFYWRVSGASTWNSIPASHSTKSRLIAANTFPTASTIQWKIQVTDRSGLGTAESSVFSFTTVSTQISMTRYPSGNNVNPGAVLPFQWKYNSAVGEYSQSSAVFYWRKDTTDPYTAINISGSTQGINVPANTFPTSSTIYWYVSGTDIGGHTSSTSATSFKTPATQITPQSSPTSGYRDPRNAIKFSWYFACADGSVPQGSASLFWKVHTDANYTEAQASGTTRSVTIAADTFPVASTIDWYLSGEDMWGVSSTSEVFSFSTAASTAIATCVSPVGSAEDSAKPITLVWTLSNEDGADPTRVLVSWKLPSEGSLDWHTLVDSSDPITSYAVPAYTFPAGEIQWKVQATNRDNVAGPESLAAFVSLRAPDPPEGLTATDVPITTISWQSDSQQAYEITIDGTVVQKAFGIGIYDWTVPEPLDDGVHIITVRVQSSFGLWSDPSTTTIDVSNDVPEGWEDLALTGVFDVDAALTATGASDADSIEAQWYRDGKRIGTTAGREFTDRFALGEHAYYVEIWDTDGNYARSNTVTGTMSSQITRIALLAGGPWIELRLSENSAGLQSFSFSRTKNIRHVLGAVYPILELSPFEDLSGVYDCAFKTSSEAAAFESMRGQPVILKSRSDRIMIGALADLSCKVTDFYISYSFSIQRIDWEDYVYDS